MERQMNNIPDVHANDRAIPAGKVLVAEYTQIPHDAPRAVPILLDKAPSRQFPKRMLRLEAVPAGWAIAGSMLRWDNGRYSVSFDLDGARHGRSFLNFDDALALFNTWTR
jgi:hypothetical protein